MSIRTAARRLMRSPGFSLSVIVLVALTVASTIVLVTITRGTVLLPSSPVEPDRMIRLYTSDDTRSSSASGRYGRSSLSDFRDIEDALAGSALVAAYNSTSLPVRHGDREFAARVTFASDAYFAVAAIRPFLGSTAPGAEPGAVISYGFWRGQLARVQSVLGAVLVVNGRPIPVSAVMPPAFTGTDYSNEAEIWLAVELLATLVPEEPDPGENRDDRRFDVVGRLLVGATLASTQTQAGAVSATLQRQEPTTNGRRSFLAVPFPHMLGPGERDLLGLDQLLRRGGALALALLLLGYANVANLFAVRGLRAQREVAIRKALGGSDGRMLRTAFGELVLLVLPAAGAGWVVATLFLRSLVDHPLFWRSQIALDQWTVGTTTLAVMLATVLLGAVPMYWMTVQTPAGALRLVASDTPMKHRRVLWGLVSLQLVVAACAGSLVLGAVRNARSLEAIPVGFDLDRLVDMRVQLHAPGIGPEVDRIVSAFLDRVRGLPGVHDVVTAEVPLLVGTPLRQAIGVVGRQFPDGSVPNVRFDVVGPDYFRITGLAMREGGFSDGVHLQPSFSEVVVNESFAAAFLPSGKALGSEVILREVLPVRVVGVVRNAVTDALLEREEPRMYLPHRRAAAIGTFQLVVRTARDADLEAADLERRIRGDAGVARVTGVESLSRRRANLIAPVRTLAWVMGLIAFALSALVAIGVHGLMSVTIESQRRALAIRVALGASPSRVVMECVRPALIALCVGLLGAMAVVWAVGFVALDAPLTFSGVAISMALLACLIGAVVVRQLIQVLRLPPAEVLRA